MRIPIRWLYNKQSFYPMKSMAIVIEDRSVLYNIVLEFPKEHLVFIKEVSLSDFFISEDELI